MSSKLPKLLHSTRANPTNLLAIGGLGHGSGVDKLSRLCFGLSQDLDAADPTRGGLDSLGEGESTLSPT